MAKSNRYGEKLVRTSVQLPQRVLDDISTWFPTISRSEAIRLILDRETFLAARAFKQLSDMLDDFPGLKSILVDFDHEDFRTIAKCLPSIIADERLVKATLELSDYERIKLLDTVIADRQGNSGSR